MAMMTVRNLDEDLKARLRIRAAQHGHSMEEEVRNILRRALREMPEATTGAELAKAIRTRMKPFGGIDLELPAREPMRDAPDFGA